MYHLKNGPSLPRFIFQRKCDLNFSVDKKLYFKVTIEDALDRTRFVANDADFSVWKMMSNGVSYARNILQFTENKEILNGYLVGLVDHYYQKMGWRTDLDTISDMDRQAMTLALGILKIT